jgi:hypothetical protein
MRWMRLAVALVSATVVLSACSDDGSSTLDGYVPVQLGAAELQIPEDWTLVREDQRHGEFDLEARGPGDELLFGVARTVTTTDVAALLGEQRSARVRALPGYEEVGDDRAVTVINGDGRRIDYTYDDPALGVSGRGVDIVTLGPGGSGALVSVTATDRAFDEREFDTIANSIRYADG